MSWARRAAALLASGTLLGVGCGGRERERVVVQDLAGLALAASYEGPLEHVVFTLPGAARTGLEGLVQPLEPHDEPGVWLRPSATLRLGGAPGAARRIVVELEPHPGSERLALLALWNDRKAGRFTLEAGRRRYVIDAPRTAAAAENRLTLRFHGAATRLPVYRGRLAARIFALWAGRAGEESLAPERAGGDPPVSVRSKPESRDIVLAPGALRFALVLPQRSELRFSSRLLAGTAASLRITLATRPGEERELWRGQPGGEAVVPLAAGAGQRAWLSLHVDAADLATRVAFTLPRLLGEPEDSPPPPHSERDEARADALRSALSGANVMLVILDSAGARHLGPWGGPAQASPEIQRLASEGVVFENVFTPAVYTL